MADWRNTDTLWGKAHYSAKLFSDRHYRDCNIWIVEEVISRRTVYYSGERDLLVNSALTKEGATLEIFVKANFLPVAFTAQEAWAIALSLEP